MTTEPDNKTKSRYDNPYLEGDEEFVDPHLIKNVFPDPENPMEEQLHDLFKHNKRYFAEVKGHDLTDLERTEKFKPNKEKLDLRVGSVKNSIYRKDYVEHDMSGTGYRLPFPCNSLNYRVPMEMTTTNRTDFNKPHIQPGNAEFDEDFYKTQPARRRGPNDGVEHIKAPFPGGSSYKNQYVSWGVGGAKPQLKPINAKTVYDGMKFHGKPSNSIYGSYDADEIDPNTPFYYKKFGHPTYKNPIGPEIPFLGETSTACQFKPFRVCRSGGGPKLERSIISYPTYINQYKTIYCDYDGRQTRRIGRKNPPSVREC